MPGGSPAVSARGLPGASLIICSAKAVRGSDAFLDVSVVADAAHPEFRFVGELAVADALHAGLFLDLLGVVVGAAPEHLEDVPAESGLEGLGNHADLDRVGDFLELGNAQPGRGDLPRPRLAIRPGDVITISNGTTVEVDNTDAERRLGGIADAWLLHDREIVNRVDDSVARVMDGEQSGPTDTATVTLTVTPANDPPVMAAIDNQSVDELTTLAFTATATDIGFEISQGFQSRNICDSFGIIINCVYIR